MSRMLCVLGLGCALGLAKLTSAIEINETFSGEGPYFITDFAASVLGDYSNNGTVDAADYVAWRDRLGVEDATLTNDATPTGVAGEDYDYWKANFGTTRPSVTGFDASGWNRSGTFQTGLGTFDTVAGTYDIPQKPVAFILNLPALDSDVWQAIGGVNRTVMPGGPIELTTGVKNIVYGTAKEQRLMTQLNFGTSLGISNTLLEFIDLQLVYDPSADVYSLIANPLLDGAPAVGAISINPRTSGLIAPDEHINAIDWHVLIDADEVNGGSNVLVEFDLNNSGEWTPFFSTPITGQQYTVDLTAAPSLNLIMLAYGSPGLLPAGSPDPEVTGPAASFDRFVFSTPDPIPELASVVPEPATISLLLTFVSAPLVRLRSK